MKTRPDLLLRDALAQVYVRAAEGDASARRVLEELAAWTPGKAPGPALRDLHSEDGTVLFTPNGSLAKGFSGLEGYICDRGRRFAAALEWIREEGSAGDPVACARAAWDAGLFFEMHEVLEPVWMRERGERRRVLQGMIMAGAALHHLTHGNVAGARGLLRDAAQRLAEASPHEPLDLVRFGRELEELAALIESGQVKHVGEVHQLPRLRPRPSH